MYGFLGPNGAGKSTTVHMLTTLLPPTSGTARVGGHDVVREGPAVRAAIGAALQEAALDPFLTGAEHMRLQTALHGIRGAEGKRRSGELLSRVGLTQAADRKVGGYSGGMKRRLDLALALVHEPRILFLDEPTTGLDPQSRSALWDEVQRLASDSGVTVFLTTQYLEEADVLADRIGIIDHGRIVAEGTPEALKAEISRPTLEVIPAEHGRARPHARGAGPLRRGGQLVAQGRGGAPVRGRGPAGRRGARARRRGHPRPAPAAARADARRRLPREDRPLARGRRREEPEEPEPRRSWPREPVDPARPGRRAGPPLGGAHAAPARDGGAVAGVPADAAGDQLERARLGHPPARLPDRLLLPVRAGDPVRPGRALLRQQRWDERGERHRDRLPQPARRSRRCAAWR